MLYLVTTHCQPDSILPYGEKEGFDRLDFESPYPGVYDLTVQLINNGDLNRLWGPYDSATQGVTESIITIAFNTLSGAQEWKSMVDAAPSYGCEITEILEPGDPGYVAP